MSTVKMQAGRGFDRILPVRAGLLSTYGLKSMSTVSTSCQHPVYRLKVDIHQNNHMYDIDRKTASRLLKISVRTVDRYINSQKVSHERRDGRIWLDKKEIMQLKARRRVDRVDSTVEVSTSKMSIDKVDLIPVDMSIDSEGNTYHSVTRDDGETEPPDFTKKGSPKGRARAQEDDVEVYKNLYEQLQQDLRDKEQHLEMANYRLGQLEARIKETIPLLDYKRDLANEQLEKDQLRKNLDSHLMELDVALNNYREERFNKRIYLILLFILLLLQPLWFLFPIN